MGGPNHSQSWLQRPMGAQGRFMLFLLDACGINIISFLFPNRKYYFWSFQKIKNPNYKGKWKAPLIDNPGWLFSIDVIKSQIVFQRSLLLFKNFVAELLNPLLQTLRMTPSSMFTPNWNMLVLSCGRYSFLLFPCNPFLLITYLTMMNSYIDDPIYILDIRWNQAPCLTMSWLLTIRNMQRTSPKKHGASTRRYIFKPSYSFFFFMYLVLIEFDTFFKVEKAAFEEAEKKREEEVNIVSWSCIFKCLIIKCWFCAFTFTRKPRVIQLNQM